MLLIRGSLHWQTPAEWANRHAPVASSRTCTHSSRCASVERPSHCSLYRDLNFIAFVLCTNVCVLASQKVGRRASRNISLLAARACSGAASRMQIPSHRISPRYASLGIPATVTITAASVSAITAPAQSTQRYRLQCFNNMSTRHMHGRAPYVGRHAPCCMYLLLLIQCCVSLIRIVT
jgi:hypothetical protein